MLAGSGERGAGSGEQGAGSGGNRGPQFWTTSFWTTRKASIAFKCCMEKHLRMFFRTTKDRRFNVVQKIHTGVATSRFSAEDLGFRSIRLPCVQAFSRIETETRFPHLVSCRTEAPRPMELVILERKSHLLTPSRLPCLGSLPTLRLASGCMHGCLDCYAQNSCGCSSSGMAAGSEKVVLAANCLKKLQEELGRRQPPPQAVVIDFSSDLFQPVPELLDRTYEVLEYLLDAGIGVVFQTKAKIPQRHRELLLAHAPLVRAIIPLVTIDRRLLRIFEPRTATPRTRLSQMRNSLPAAWQRWPGSIRFCRA